MHYLASYADDFRNMDRNAKLLGVCACVYIKRSSTACYIYIYVTVDCLLLVVHGLVSIVCCMVYIVDCRLYSVYCSCMLYTACSKSYRDCALCIMLCYVMLNEYYCGPIIFVFVCYTVL